MFSEPLAGRRQVEVTDRRTKQDYAQQMKYLVDVLYPDAEVIIELSVLSRQCLDRRIPDKESLQR